ncbi:zinc finger protein ZPR1-like [Babylonia areolata]|uniref:zinc finger protein ZPR1-like n=1 Tax=Babylonia areolata TaxID=304850 RepID=UPI003FD6BDB3
MSGEPSTEPKQPLFRDITAEEDEPEITEIESFCVSCEKQGVTRLFLTKIPFFREVIVSSFSCDECGYRNAELQPAGRIQDYACLYKVNIQNPQDLNRQVVQSHYAVIRIPALDFEAAPKKGVLTTVEGILTQVIDNLTEGQVLRKIQDPETAAKIDAFVDRVKAFLQLETSFDIEVDDPSGNSFVENLYPLKEKCSLTVDTVAPSPDHQMAISHYSRTHKQDIEVGIFVEGAEEEIEGESKVGTKEENFDTTNEVLHFQTNCPHCNTPCETNMKLVNIPFFKEVVIMATNCEACGHRDNEVKSGGGIEERGRKITIRIDNREDMSRDVLKSETSIIRIPELDFETEMGTLGGKFTTVEGLLEDIKRQLGDSNPFLMGDSCQPQATDKLRSFCDNIDQIVKGERTQVHIILDDPAGNSYIQSLTAPDPDPQMVVEVYERDWDQNEALGLNDMKTENYQQS